MKYALMIVPFLCIVFALICLGLYIIGIVHYLVSFDDKLNTCELPYMFEFPEFVEIAMDKEISEQYPGFDLYVYGEGDEAEKLRQMKYLGIPVLFVPGHGGSHRQMRSIASVSLKMSLEQHVPFHFDFFTVSLAEGLSALSGGVIEKQTDFVSICIHRILRLYNGTIDQIVIIGHSMGGVVARAALLQVASNISLASVLINLASPYRPLVAFERTFSNYYNEVNNDEIRLHEMGTTIITISGGPRDHQVATSYVIDPHADLNVLTTAIPNVWESTDHLSILWCKQFVAVLVRALFNSVDMNKPVAKIIFNPEERLRKLKYDLANRYATGHPIKFVNKTNFESDGEWIEIISPNLIFDMKNYKNRQEESKPIYLMIPIKPESSSYLSIDTINLAANDWLFICKALVTKDGAKTCEFGWSLTNYTILSPDYQQRLRKTVNLEFQILSLKFTEETHVIIQIPMMEIRKELPPIVYIDRFSRETRQIHIDNILPVWLPSSLGSIITAPEDATIEALPGTLRYFVNISTIPDTIYVTLNAIIDNNHNSSPGYIVIQMREMYNNHNSAMSQFHIFNEGDIGLRRTLHLQTGNDESVNPNLAEIIISFEPRFHYSIQIGRAGIIDRMANFIKNRAHRLYPTMMCTLLLFTVARIDKSQYSMPITFGITIIASVVLDLCLEICVAVCILLILAMIICWSVIFIGTIIHHFIRFITRPLARLQASWYDSLICQTFNNLPLVTIILLITFILCRCGALVMLLSALLYFLQVTCLYKNYLENSLMSSVRDFIQTFRKSNKHNFINERKREEENISATVDTINHLLLVMIWFLTVGCGIPSILVWWRELNYKDILFSEDTVMLSSWIVLTTWSSLGFIKLPTIFECHCYRMDPITIIQRLISWLLLWIAGSNKPVYYQWMIPPIVVLFISCHYIHQHCLCLAHCNSHFSELKNL